MDCIRSPGKFICTSSHPLPGGTLGLLCSLAGRDMSRMPPVLEVVGLTGCVLFGGWRGTLAVEPGLREGADRQFWVCPKFGSSPPTPHSSSVREVLFT